MRVSGWPEAEPARRGLRSGAAAGQDAELVALRVGQDNPALLALADIGVPGAQAEQAADLLALLPVGRAEVEMEPVLDALALGHAGEGQYRRHRAAVVLAAGRGRRADGDDCVVLVLHLVVKDRAPEPGQAP